MTSFVERLYLPGTRDARQTFFSTIGDRLVSDNVSASELELFFIFFSALGVQMTEPVESWIRRAGERCEALGFVTLGRALKMHAAHEANHHLMMIEDTHGLVARWNGRHGLALDAASLLASRPTGGIEAYVRLHEDVIGSATPFCQLAIEYEIEGLSVSLGPRLMDRCERRLGGETLAGLSFLQEHVAIDVGHTKFNEAQLERLLESNPLFAEPLCQAGSLALTAYGRFLDDCLLKAVDACQNVGADPTLAPSGTVLGNARSRSA